MEINHQDSLLKRNWVGVGRTALPIDGKHALKANRLGGKKEKDTHFQVPSAIAQSIDKARIQISLQSVIENKADINCLQVHLQILHPKSFLGNER